MKILALIGGLLLLVLLVSPAGHGAHHRHPCCPNHHAAQLLPLRVMRTPAVARQPRRVRAVR